MVRLDTGLPVRSMAIAYSCRQQAIAMMLPEAIQVLTDSIILPNQKVPPILVLTVLSSVRVLPIIV